MNEPISVLIVDDHALVRKGLRATIEELGTYRVLEAAATADALEAARQQRPAVGVIDIVLPEGDGIHLVRELLGLLPEMRILMISMHSRRDYVTEAFRAGARGYVVKGSSPAAFLAGLQCVAAGHYFLDGGMPFRLGELLTPVLGSAGSDEEVRYGALTAREQEVMRHLAQGLSCRDIADRLGLSVKTVDNHRASILNKLGLDTTVELVHFAVRLGLLDPRASE